MIAETKHPPLRLLAVVLAAALLFTACAGGAKSTVSQLELGRKYLTEMNYSEAIAAFTEAIKLNPDDIEAYLGRAEAYAAMGEYEKAKADYDTVLEKAGDDPYTQAQAYAGRAGVDEQADQPEDAERDYTAALTRLDKDTDQQDADAVRTLKKDVLAKHAAVCITLALLDKAAEDYDALEQLGENVAAKRKELESLLPDTGTSSDAENGLTPDAPDADTPADADTPETTDTADTAETPETKDIPDSKETAADSKQEQPASSKEEATSSKEEQSAQQVEKKETYQAIEDQGCATGSVTYQVGTNTIWATDKIGGEDLWNEWDYTYTLSQPVLSVEHPHTGSTLFHVPEGTVVTLLLKAYGADLMWTGETEADGSGKYVSEPYSESYDDIYWGTISSADKLLHGEEMDNTQDTASMTVKKGKIYVITDAGEGGPIIRYPAIGFVAD